MRLAPNRPTRRDLTAFVALFADSLDEPLSRTPATIAERLGAVSYAEAEEFCRDVRRRRALAPGAGTLAAIVVERLKLWTERAQAAAGGETTDGGVPRCCRFRTRYVIDPAWTARRKQPPPAESSPAGRTTPRP